MFETVATALEAAATTLTTMLGQLMRPPEATLEAIAVGQPAAAVATQVTVVAEETSDETPAPPVWRWRSFEVLGYWLRGLIGAGWLW